LIKILKNNSKKVYGWRVCGSGFLGAGACLVATGYIKCHEVTMIVIAGGLSGISMAGWAVNHLDLAPTYAGIPSSSSSLS